MEAQQIQKADIDEAVALGALDGAFFGEYFFPKTFRQRTPDFLRQVWDSLDTPLNRHVGIQVFRGGAKTTTLRAFTAKRIAYGISHTIMYIGKSQDHAKRSLRWIMKQVEYNTLYAQTFGLSKGKKWTEEECEIIHKVLDQPITLLAVGITGSVRGVNVDDYRPDLIVLDDVIDEENSKTHEARNKINALIFGAVDKSLAPESEEPQAKLVMLQTPLDGDDASEQIQNDMEWHPLRFSCFDYKGESIWPERFSTEVLLRDKASAIRRNQLSIWLREMECSVIGDEKRYFGETWLNEWVVKPDFLVVAIGIDPSPPKDEDANKRKTKDPDPEVLAAVGIINHEGVTKRYILEQVKIQDPNPEKTVIELARMIRKWHPIVLGVETTAFQASLKWYVEKAMDAKRCPRVAIEGIDDRRSKVKRIRHFYTNACDNDELYYHASMHEFKEQFKDYPEVKHDDLLEAPVLGFSVLETYEGMGVDGEYLDGYDEDNIESLPQWRCAP